MKTTNSVIEQFIIEETLITPIEKIINQFKNLEFRDCDIKWLNGKLETYTKLAAQTLGMTIHLPETGLNGRVLNDHVKNIYISRFTTLLNYFKGF